MFTIETHGDEAKTTYTAELLAALIDTGRLPFFTDEVVERGLSWHAICRLEDDALAFERHNRWCGSTDGWWIVAGMAHLHEGADVQARIDEVPQYVGWGRVQAWLEHGEAIVTIEPGYGVHVYDREFFEEMFAYEPFVKARFADDSAMHMNRAFRWLSADDAAFLSLSYRENRGSDDG